MIDLSIDGDIAEIVLAADGEHGVLDAGALGDLAFALADAESAGVQALVLRSDAADFSAGGELAAAPDRHGDGERDALDPRAFGTEHVVPLLEHLASFPAPTFAAAQGRIAGVGVGILGAIDVAIVADDASIAAPFAAVGASIDAGSHAFFVRGVGAARTLDLVYAGSSLSGADAAAIGMVARALPAASLTDAVREAAAVAAAGPTSVFAASKDLVRELRDERIALARAVTRELKAQRRSA